MIATRQRALITGASAGLGSEFARQLAAANKDLILIARRADPLQALANELRQQYGVDVVVITADLVDPAAPQMIAQQLDQAELTVDYLINNAGSAGPDFLTERSWQAHRAYFELMVTSAVALCHLLIPGMQARQFGRILNVASVAARIPRAGDYTYGSAKAYLIAFSEGMSLSLRDQGIHTLALCPGFVHTDFHTSEALASMKAQTPKFLWYNSDVVVREGLHALEQGKAVYVSGRLYRWLDPFLQSKLTRGLFIKLLNSSR